MPIAPSAPPSAHTVENLLIRHSMMAAGAGLLPLPLVDLAAITVINLKLLRELAALYGVPYESDLARQSFVGLVGGMSTQLLVAGPVYSLLRLVPAVGWIVGGASIAGVAGGITYATGRVFSRHFEKGGNFQNFSAESFRRLFEAEAKVGADRVRSEPSPRIVEAVHVEVLPPDPAPPYREPELSSVDAEEVVYEKARPAKTQNVQAVYETVQTKEPAPIPAEEEPVIPVPVRASSEKATTTHWADLFPSEAEIEIDFGNSEDDTDERPQPLS